jgi:hypothetical protein
MLNRLGLVIHWIGFVVGLILIAAVIQYGLWRESITQSRGLFGDIIWKYNLYSSFIYSPVVFLIPFLGWPLRFILTNHKNPLPWVANKETNND